MKRTISQNKAMWKFLDQFAQAARDAGYDMPTLIEEMIIKGKVPPTKERIKHDLWDYVLKALYPELSSTTELSTTQMQELYRVFDQAAGERLQIHVEWPSEESLSEEQRDLQ